MRKAITLVCVGAFGLLAIPVMAVYTSVYFALLVGNFMLEIAFDNHSG